MAGGEDLFAALRFFHGKLVLRRRDNHRYERPTDGVGGIDYALTADEERESREAIVRLLSLPNPPEQLLHAIAEAFAPSGPTAGARRADLTFREPKRPVDDVRKVHIITMVAHRLKDMTLEEARADVALVTGETEEAVKGIWERNTILRDAILGIHQRK
jgi:hypothetical protein